MTSGGETAAMPQEGSQANRTSGGDDANGHNTHDPHHQSHGHQQHHPQQQQPYLSSYFPGTHSASGGSTSPTGNVSNHSNYYERMSQYVQVRFVWSNKGDWPTLSIFSFYPSRTRPPRLTIIPTVMWQDPSKAQIPKTRVPTRPRRPWQRWRPTTTRRSLGPRVRREWECIQASHFHFCFCQNQNQSKPITNWLPCRFVGYASYYNNYMAAAVNGQFYGAAGYGYGTSSSPHVSGGAHLGSSAAGLHGITPSGNGTGGPHMGPQPIYHLSSLPPPASIAEPGSNPLDDVLKTPCKSFSFSIFSLVGLSCWLMKRFFNPSPNKWK